MASIFGLMNNNLSCRTSDIYREGTSVGTLFTPLPVLRLVNGWNEVILIFTKREKVEPYWPGLLLLGLSGAKNEGITEYGTALR